MEEVQATASVPVWIGLILVAAASFWVQATVTEERFVPALNVIASHFNIPDDVAGATLMAAGASSPEFFSAVVSLFITHSSLGIGTIVGSEVFNQLVICAGAALEGRHGRLVLNKPIVIRETGFYALSIILLYYALSVSKPLENDPDGPNHLYVSLFPTCLLVLAYILYVLVMAYFEQILIFLGVKSDEGYSEEKLKSITRGGVKYGAFYDVKDSLKSGDHGIIFMRMETLQQEPLENFRTGRSVHGDLDDRQLFGTENSYPIRSYEEKLKPFDTDRTSDNMAYFSVSNKALTKEHVEDLEHIELSNHDGSLSCYMWHRSEFYTHSRTTMKAWVLRWMTFSDIGVTAARKPGSQHNEKKRKYPRFDLIRVDPTANLICMENSQLPHSEFTLMAPTTAILDKVVNMCEMLLDTWHTGEATQTPEISSDEYVDCDEAESLLKAPQDASKLGLALHYCLFPLKALMQFTVPDVRGVDVDPIGTAAWATFSCILWLIVGSYCMVSSLESLAELMNIPDSIVGVTVSAAGTSLPNYVASLVAARQGLGNMAVSNAFGSNVFNIFVGLGVPWLVFICFVNKGQDYTDLVDDGIVENVIILATVLSVFVVFMLFSGFVLVRWHAWVFLLMYAVYVFYNIGLVYFW